MNTCRTLVVAHGRSEMRFCKGIASNLRMNVEYDSNNDGRNCIQICHLEERFCSDHFRSELTLHNKFKKLEYFGGKDVKMPNLRIFPIMDLDDSSQMIKRYKTKNMFNASVFKDRITPIFNDPNLDAVLNKCGFGVSHDDVESYDELFNEYELSDIIGALRGCDDTNITEYLDHCLSVTPSYQNAV